MASFVGGRWQNVASAATAALDLLLPTVCAVCERLLGQGDTGIICGHCWSRARELPQPRCARCGHPGDRYDCRWCENLPPFVRSARSWCWIGGGSGKDIIHALKYDGWIRTAESIAERICRLTFPDDVISERAGVVPVPLSREKLRERGFNQCELIAQHVSRKWRVPMIDHALVRLSSARSQTRLTPGERLGNVAGAFSVPESARDAVRGKHLILLDDVVTTGATLRSAASALFASGARTLSYVTFGRAPASGDRIFQ